MAPTLDPDANVLGYAMMSFVGLGILEIGLVISFMLFGIIITQTVIYYRRYAEDSRSMRYMVATLLFLELAHSASITGIIYTISVTFSRLRNLIPQNSYPLATTNVLENLIALLVQSFFSSRVYRLSRRMSLGLLCWTLTMIRFGCGMAIAVESFIDVPRVPNGVVMVKKFGWLITLTFVFGGLVDVVIAALQVWYLRGVVSRLQDKRTLATVENVINWCLQTGLITSITSVLVIICFQIMRNQVWVALYLILGKLYSNSLLTALLLRPPRDNSKSTGGTGRSGLGSHSGGGTHFSSRSVDRYESPVTVVALTPTHGDFPLQPVRKLQSPKGMDFS